MYFKAFVVKVLKDQQGFKTGSSRPVIAMRLTGEGETELLLSTDDGELAWVDREFVEVIEIEQLASTKPRSPWSP